MERKKFLSKYKKNILSIDLKMTSMNLGELYKINTNLNMKYITFYDVLNNDKLIKLNKKISKLNKKNFTVDPSYKNIKFVKAHYILPQYNHTKTEIFSKVKFNNDNLIENIDISITQINNEEAIIEYKILFKEIIFSQNQIHEYLKKHILSLKKFDFVEYYKDVNFFIKNLEQNIELEHKLFFCLLQTRILNLSKTAYGKSYHLPLKTTYFADKKTKELKKFVEDSFLTRNYKLNDNHYFIPEMFQEYEGTGISEIIINRKSCMYDMLNMFSTYRMDLYYLFFYQIELRELEQNISRFLNSKKLFFSSKKYKWLLNKFRRLDESKSYSDDDKLKIIPINKKLDAHPFIKIGFSDSFKNIYEKNINYFSNMNNINYNIIIFSITVATLFLTLISVFIV